MYTATDYSYLVSNAKPTQKLQATYIICKKKKMPENYGKFENDIIQSVLAHIPVSYEDVSLLRSVQLTCHCWNMAVKSEPIKHRWALIHSGHKFVRTELLDISIYK